MFSYHTIELLAADRMSQYERIAGNERTRRSLRASRRRPTTARRRSALDRAELRKAA